MQGHEDRWEVCADADEVHALLCACDAHTATPVAPAPRRNPETTRRRVAAGAVHGLRTGSGLVAMFTLTCEPPFGEEDVARYPRAARPVYLARLAVRPDQLDAGSLVGIHAVRHALGLARERGADVIRAEANPDLVRVRRLLAMVGFVEHGATTSDDGRPRVYLQKVLTTV